MRTALVFAAMLAQAVPQGRPYSEERQLLDRQLAQLARPLPNGPTPDDDAALLNQLGADNGLRNVSIQAPLITENTTLGQSRRTLQADSTFPDADRFFRALQASGRFIDVEGLTLRSLEFGVHLEARLRTYHRPARAAASASLDPARIRDRTRGASKEDAARFLRDEQMALEKTIAMDDLRRRQTSPRMFLAETGASFRDAAAALSFGSFDGDSGRFTLRGVVAGDGAAMSLERRLEDGFFRVREFSRTPKDGCYQFEAVGEAFRAGPQAALPVPVDEPFRPIDPLCRQDRDAVFAGAPGSVIRVSGTGGFSLRAVDVDLADAFFMIEALSREPFVIAGDVRGRVNLEFFNVSAEEALRALPARADLVGAIRLIRPAVDAPLVDPPTVEDAAPAARMSVRAKRLRGDDLFAAIAESEPSLISIGPKNLSTLSVFVRDGLAGDLRRAAIAALGLTETREDNARVLRKGEGGPAPGPLAASNTGRVSFRPRDLAVSELSLAAIGRAGDESTVFVYSPLGEIVSLKVGDALADGFIASVEQSAVVIDTSEGPVKISIARSPGPPPARQK